jgi:hypothetical protein
MCFRVVKQEFAVRLKRFRRVTKQYLLIIYNYTENGVVCQYALYIVKSGCREEMREDQTVFSEAIQQSQQRPLIIPAPVSRGLLYINFPVTK